jgi:hypothetical protein
MKRLGIRALVAVLGLGLAACGAPYRSAKIVGGVGGVLAAGGGTAWVIGEHQDSNALVFPGVVSSLLGAACLATAAMMVAAQSSCTLDADCADGYMCRELPAPAGREPYSQCVPR